MTVIEEAVIPNNTGKSFLVKQGQYIRVSAESIVDFVVFNLDNLRERFDQGRTKANQGKVVISTGDLLYSKLNNIMMIIVEDTYKGTHDLQFGTCSRASYDGWWERRNSEAFKDNLKAWGINRREDLPDHGCWENLTDAVKNYGIAPEDIPSPLNLFMSMEIDSNGKLVWQIDRDRPEPGKPAHVDLRAEMNCLVAVSACPEMGMAKSSIRVQIYRE